MKKISMAHYSQQTYSTQCVDVIYQDRGYSSQHSPHSIYTEPVFQQHQMYSDSTVQCQIQPPTEVYRKEDLQHRTRIYRAKDIPQPKRNREVPLEEQPPPQPATLVHKRGIRDIPCKSKVDFVDRSAGHIKSFTQKNGLQRHLLNHAMSKPHICDLCNKGFTQKSHLRTHLLTHTGEKPHQCEVCHQAFSLKGNLQKHSLIHSGEKPPDCEICIRSFKDKVSMTRHNAIHSSQNHRLSAIGHIGFSRNIQLRKHIMTHNGEKDDICCETCNEGFSQKGILRIRKNVSSAYRAGKEKKVKGKRSTEKAKDQEYQLNKNDVVLEVPVQEVHQSTANQEQQEVHVDPQVFHIRKESDNCEITFPGNEGYHKQVLIYTEQQVYVENYGAFSTIDKLLTQMDNQTLNFDAQSLHFLKRKGQQGITDLLDHDLQQIEHQTGSNRSPSLSNN